MKGIYALFLCLPAALACGQDIPNDKRIEGLYQAGSTHSDKAVATIVATNTIGQQASVEYVAGKSVTLLPGFKTNRTTVFSASIKAMSLSIAPLSVGEGKKGLMLHPNPIEDVVTVTYSLNQQTRVTLIVSDERGSVLAKIVDGELQSEGTHKVDWRGGMLATGKYICTLYTDQKANSVNLIKK
ncbi:MAG: hypothetical protein EOO61_09125 [Hymenobacter sp.]|nr:MAG: hypothetical protein EOO61_09125 [Hymenobacter sp.]